MLLYGRVRDPKGQQCQKRPSMPRNRPSGLALCPVLAEHVYDTPMLPGRCPAMVCFPLFRASHTSRGQTLSLVDTGMPSGELSEVRRVNPPSPCPLRPLLLRCASQASVTLHGQFSVDILAVKLLYSKSVGDEKEEEPPPTPSAPRK